jgi:hypothetical protein
MYPFEIKNKEVEKFNDQLGDVLRELFINGDEFPYEAAMGVKTISVMFTIYRRQGASIEKVLSEADRNIKSTRKGGRYIRSLGMQIAQIQIQVIMIDTIRASFLVGQIASIVTAADEVSPSSKNEGETISNISFDEKLKYIRLCVSELSRYLREDGNYRSKQELAEDHFGKAYVWGWCKGVVGNCGISVKDPKWHMAHIQAFCWAYEGVELNSKVADKVAESIYWEFKKFLNSLSKLDKYGSTSTHGGTSITEALDRIALLSEVDFFKGTAGRNLFGCIDLHNHISHNRVNA